MSVEYSAKDIVSLSAGAAFRQKIGYSNYLIYEDGTIYSLKSKKYLVPIKKSTGYYAVNLYNDEGIRKMFFIHRLVAESFIPNPMNYPDVNHKDENKANNSVQNLEWCTKSYNENFGTKKKKEMQTKTDLKRINGHKKIAQYTLDNQFIREWESLTAAHEATNISIGNLSCAINGKRNRAGGYIWKAV